MQEQTSQSYRLIQRFAQEVINKKYAPYRALKEANKACRIYIENKLSKSSTLQKNMPLNNEQSLLFKELIVNNTLLKMHHHAVLWEIEDHKPNPLAEDEEELLDEFSSYCLKAFELMKKDKVLIEMALKAPERDFKSDFYKTMHSIITEEFKDDPSLQYFYSNRRDKCIEKFDEYMNRFSQFAKDNK